MKLRLSRLALAPHPQSTLLRVLSSPLCFLFLHVMVQPYKDAMLNRVEGLLELLIAVVIITQLFIEIALRDPEADGLSAGQGETGRWRRRMTCLLLPR